MTTLFIVRGAPGSGKTTLAKEISEDTGAVHIERDMLRIGLYGVYFGGDIDENVITAAQESTVKSLLKKGKNVVVSDTLIHDKDLNKWRKIGFHALVDKIVVADLRQTPLEILLERNSSETRVKSGKVTPENVVKKFHDKCKKFVTIPSVEDFRGNSDYYTQVKILENPLKNSEKYVGHPEGRSTYIFDIDGTIANHEGVRSPYDPTRYHLDTPHGDVIDIAKMIHNKGHYIILMSGRHQDYREATEKWLNEHGFPYDEFHMREDKFETDSIEKLNLFDKYVRNNSSVNVVGAFDDRDQVVEATWRGALGIRCYQVAPGDF